ncbi:MAG: hypothetical protein WBI63_03585 [Coriobacteriia bacterium]
MRIILVLLIVSAGIAMFAGSVARASGGGHSIVSDICLGVVVSTEVVYVLMLFARPMSALISQWLWLSLVVLVPALASVLAFAYIRRNPPEQETAARRE